MIIWKWKSLVPEITVQNQTFIGLKNNKFQYFFIVTCIYAYII